VNLNNIDLNKISIFSKVVESGNYRIAAEVLNVTPSALSQTITSLEYALGVTLFHRFGKRLFLTEEGKKIHSAFQQHYTQFLLSLTQINQAQREVSGLIRIGAYLEFAKFYLAPYIAEFQKKHSQVQIKFVFDTPSRLHHLLESHKIDLCFSIYPERQSPLIQSKPIFQEELLLLSPNHWLSTNPTYTELLSTPMIEYYFNHQPIRRWLYLHFKKKPKTLPIRTYASTSEMVYTLIQEGLGAGIVPGYLLQSKIPKGLIVCRPTVKKLIDHIWMLQLKGKATNHALDLFTQYIADKLLKKA